MKTLQRVLLALVLLFAASGATAQLSVPAGGSFALGGGSLDLAGTDLQLGGLFSLGSGSLFGTASIAISSGGSFDAGTGQATLSGNWSNAGNFISGGGSVNFIDGGAVSQIGGNTSFASLSFVSATGKSYVFAAGSTQSISGRLTITGTAARPVQFRSPVAGQVANIDLLAGGTQDIAHVGVSDVHATGQHLAPALSNEGGSGNAAGWFAAFVAQPTAAPASALWSSLLLSVALFWLAFRRAGADRHSPPIR